MLIRAATLADVEAWAKFRHALWPALTIAEHRGELVATLQSGSIEVIAFVAVDDDTQIVGFAEAGLRRDYVNGCETSPVAFLEGVFVRPEFRRSGVGRSLNAAVETWAREKGCTELASDTHLENADSNRFHSAVGFEETERVVFYRRRL